jgi:hypothetical protein
MRVWRRGEPALEKKRIKKKEERCLKKREASPPQ